MGQRQKKFESLVLNKFSYFKHEKLSYRDIETSVFVEDIREIYEKLGGQLNHLPIRYGPWDISTLDFIIELDEERHFNRYRRETLKSYIYKNNSLFSRNAYQTYCEEYENNCLKAASWGGNWKNNSTEKMFMESNKERDLSGNGSSRWKQRAFYDYLKDLTAIIKGIPVIRVSIYDEYQNKTINDLLKGNEDNTLNNFLDVIIKKHIK